MSGQYQVAGRLQRKRPQQRDELVQVALFPAEVQFAPQRLVVEIDAAELVREVALHARMLAAHHQKRIVTVEMLERMLAERDFDRSLDSLRGRLTVSSFPWLAANVFELAV